VRRQAEELMTLRRIRPVLLFLALATPAFAQDARSVDLPNAMNIHTWFIIGAAGAFLAWCISYAIQLQREAMERKSDHGDLRQQKEELLDKLAQIEAQKENGEISDQRYKHEHKELRFRLAKVLEQMGNLEGQKSAKKTS
jgi:hypothetical protein